MMMLLGLLWLMLGTVMVRNVEIASNAAVIVGCYIFIGVAAKVAILAEGDPLPLREAWFIVAVGPITTYFAVRDAGPELAGSYTFWTAFPYSLVLSMLIVRGRPVLAWVGVGATAAVIAEAVRDSDINGAAIVAAFAPAGTVAAVTVFRMIMRPTMSSLYALHAEATIRAAADATLRAQNEERDRQLERLDELARPMLDLIARGDVLTVAQREECRLLEAELRDGLRAPQLSSKALIAAARGARRRGVEVVLLDDGGFAEASPQARVTVLDVAARALDGANIGSVTVRVLPVGRRYLASVLVSEPSEDRRTEIDRDGAVTVA
jgi:hypothetical protein